MPFEPAHYIGEILGREASDCRFIRESDFICPYIERRCTKRSTQLPNEPYPVCSVKKTVQGKSENVVVCPNRFHQVDFLRDVIDHCWAGSSTKELQIAREVKMRGFGNVDFVIADIDGASSVKNFLSVELQAIDITGSVMHAFEAITSGHLLERPPTYGLNWDNVYKRYITQLIRKGYFHHHWGTKIVAVLQDVVYDYICHSADFMRSSDIHNPSVNIIFLVYTLNNNPDTTGFGQLSLSRIEGTSHANLQQAILYKEPPDREIFCKHVLNSLTRYSN